MRKWLPLAPAGTPGVWWSINNMVPLRGGGYYPGTITATHNTTIPASPGTTLRAWCALLEDDTAIRYVGTTTKLYVYDGTSTYTDRSKVGGYTSTATDWSFCQFGQITIATNRVDAPQARDASSVNVFADMAAAAPKARICVTQAEQVLFFDLNDGAEKGNAFAACAPGDHTDWSSASATTATRIRHRPGKITAAIAFRDYVLVFKQSSVYKLTYTGGTYKWRVELIAIGKGAWGKHDVVNTGEEVVFSGPGGAWRFDGFRFRSIADFVGETPTAIGSLFAPLSGNVFFFRSVSSQTTARAYNIYFDAWGAMALLDGSVNANGRPMTGEPAALAAVVAPTTTNPDLVWLVNLSTFGVKKNSTLWGGGNGDSAQAAKLSSGVEGAGQDLSTHLSRLIPRYTTSIPDLVTYTTPPATSLRLDVYEEEAPDLLYSFADYGTPILQDVASSTAQRRFDINRSVAYARFVIKVPSDSGYTEITDFELVNTKQAGKR